MPARPAVKVLYLMGHGWSGSTILGNVLGELDGFFHAGELRTVWDEARAPGVRCGCGEPILECRLWSAVLAHPLLSGVDPGQASRWHRSAARVRNTRMLLRMSPSDLSRRGDVEAYAGVASALYRAIGDVTGARVIVDSSKRAGDAAMLRLVRGVEPYFVHLVRDSRAVAYSWRKRNEPGHGPVATSRDWMAYNLLDEAIRRRTGSGRSVRVRYEDFVRQPQATLERVVAMVGEPRSELPLRGERTVMLGPNHTILGNPVRFMTGEVELRDDANWRRHLPAIDRAIVTALTWPLHLRYGYGIHTQREADRFGPVSGADRLAPGSLVHGVVVEHHPWGVELQLDEEEAFGTVDIIHLSDESHQWSPTSYPPIGSRRVAVVQGQMPTGQLRLSLRETDIRAAGGSSETA